MNSTDAGTTPPDTREKYVAALTYAKNDFIAWIVIPGTKRKKLEAVFPSVEYGENLLLITRRS